MAKHLSVRIFPDGLIQADIHGLKGKKCTEYIRILEEILEAEAVDSAYTPEYFQTDEAFLTEVQQQRLGEDL